MGVDRHGLRRRGPERRDCIAQCVNQISRRLFAHPARHRRDACITPLTGWLICTQASRGGKSTQLKSAGVKIEDIGRGQIGTKELFVADGVAFSVARAYEPAPLAKMFGIKEVVTTFAVQPDGTVGTAPTSTTKSRLHYEKPEVARNRQEGIY